MSAGFQMSPEILRNARLRAATEDITTVEALAEEAGEPEENFLDALAGQLGYPCIDLAGLESLTPAFDELPYAEASRRSTVVLRDGDTLLAVLVDPFDIALQSWLQCRVSVPLRWVVAGKTVVKDYLARQAETLRAVEETTAAENEPSSLVSGIEDLSLESIADDHSPVVKAVNSTLYDAIRIGASDVHLERLAGGLQIKYRIDGVLAPITRLAGAETAAQVVSRIKVMAELDIAEKRVPQDGRFKLSIKGRPIDFRVSIMPSLHGEDVVLRILDKDSLADQMSGLRLDVLGFDPETMSGIRRLISEPYGMFLVTGPTGSGKTTTLYAAISEINDGLDKIVTIEDPVEYQLAGVLQIPVNEKKGLTFARGLRSILRHDPDKIMVGEIRDPETARIAVQSALTGHLVFTSVHANNVFDVLGRFLHMEVDVHSFVSALNGILAQRLVRLTCRACAEPYLPDDALLARSGLNIEATAGAIFLRGKGCVECRGSGYRGRHAIGELLIFDDTLRELVTARAPIREIKAAAAQAGTRLLRQMAEELVFAGRTTLEEINRVTFVA
ncbi:MAG: type II/IV secretion system protein [Betaproteobacteria bacterium]|nr:type II/IV secretion system protein [Betaproteobacteria bacterium]